jgi:L-ribulokinase
MSARRLALGLDLGTESMRAVLVNCAGGEMLASAVSAYEHGVMEETLRPAGVRLPSNSALQHPGDYLQALQVVVREVAKELREPEELVGIGVDSTACSMLPVTEQLQPLAELPEFAAEPQAYLKLWKHHGANAQAAALNEQARATDQPWLQRYGGTTSSEWMLAKGWETLQRAPAVYQAAAAFVEVSDWLVAQLTGQLVRGACAAGYKGLWNGHGFVSQGFLRSLDPALERFFVDKMQGPIQPAGSRAGTLSEAWAERLGLRPHVAVSPAIIDAHAAVPGCGVTRPGALVLILGTSTCHMLLGNQETLVPGIQGVVAEGILPGFFGYEAGQAATGDILNWFVEKLFSGSRSHAEWTAAAEPLTVGASGLLALDWWNGNRSVLIRPELSGLLVGLTLSTRPEEIYRALIEATAFGTRKIIENFTEHGLAIESLHVCGGMAEKNDLLLQVYADVTGRPLRKADSPQVCALGAAIFGALAAGAGEGGYDSAEEAVQAMVPDDSQRIQPSPGNGKIYDRLYEHWTQLHDHFGAGGQETMPFLRSLRGE